MPGGRPPLDSGQPRPRLAPHRTPSDRLLAAGTRLTVPEGHLLAREGEAGDDLFIVIEGAVMLFKSLPDRRRQVVGFGFPDEPVSTWRPGARWPVTVQALTRCRLGRLSHPAVRRLAEADPEVCMALFDWAGGEIAARQEQLMTVGRKDTLERIAAFLLEISGRSGPAPAGTVYLPMNRAAIADYLGLRTETVSRAFARLVKRRLLALPQRSQVTLIDRPALEALARGRKPVAAPAPAGD